MSYSKPKFKASYGNFINGKFIEPVGGEYFENTSPIDKSLIAKYPRSQKEDVELALDAANAAKEAWG
ncbi:MAG: aldehyde dehydrogenase family protein, partial [Flavobacteriaceae bacterium]|nr:aldehyde dehydrogenase family protein [Flavobacteriaceae bacterium]